MLRFFGALVALAALCAGAVILLGFVPGIGTSDNPTTAKGKAGNGAVVQPADPADGKPAPDREAPSAATLADTAKVRIMDVKTTEAAAAPLVLQEGRIIPTERQDVPSERDGKLLFLATPVKPGETVPKNKLIEFEVSILAIIPREGEKFSEAERIIDPLEPKRQLRKVRSTDTFEPGTTTVVRQKHRYRKLDVGDRVEEGDFLGIINPALTVAELGIKQQNIDGAEADVKASIALYVEYERRVAGMKKLRSIVKTGVTDDEYGAAVATRDKYKEEEVTKRAAVKKAQGELSQAWTTLNLHEIRASISGVIKALYKQNGEAVKNNEAVLQIQNPDRLRVEAQVEVQDALSLRDRLVQARKFREEARRLWLQGSAQDQQSARQYLSMADALLAVEVEASRVEPPRAVLSGHLQPVTCVAVSMGRMPRIISGSEDQTVRIWDRMPGVDNRWKEQYRLDHRAVVRALACTGKKSKRNLLLTATATGRGRIFDLDNLKEGELELKERHGGAINAVAFNEDGTLCVTGGEDRSICVWETSEGKLLGKKKSAHRAGVTSLQFTPQGQLISAGDRRLLVWNLVDAGEGNKSLERADSLERRSGEVGQLGVDPTGQYVLFDEGRELRVLSLATQGIEGALSNPVGTPSFSTFAMYSPDGHTILTNGNATGRLQLWRAPSSKTRAAELRNFVWSSGTVTSAAFDPKGSFVATGTQDGRVLVWEMPSKAEAEKPLPAQLSYVEEFLDTSLRKVSVRANLDNPGWLIPGGNATIVVPPRPAR